MDVIIYHNPDCGTSRNTLERLGRHLRRRAEARQSRCQRPGQNLRLQQHENAERWSGVAASGRLGPDRDYVFRRDLRCYPIPWQLHVRGYRSFSVVGARFRNLLQQVPNGDKYAEKGSFTYRYREFPQNGAGAVLISQRQGS